MPIRAPSRLGSAAIVIVASAAAVKQQTVDRGFVLVGDIGDRTRQREDEVEVADGQQFGLTLGEPFLGAAA